MQEWFVAVGGAEEQLTGTYEVADPLELQWGGLDRYWRKVVGRF